MAPILREVLAFLRRDELMRCARTSREVYRLAQDLNRWCAVRETPDPRWWSELPAGSRVLVDGVVEGKVRVRGSHILLVGTARGQLTGSLVCAGGGCSVVVCNLSVRKVLATKWARCCVHSCTVSNPYGNGIQFSSAHGCVQYCRIHGCSGAGVLLQDSPRASLLCNSVDRCRTGVSCLHQRGAAAGDLALHWNTLRDTGCAVEASRARVHLAHNRATGQTALQMYGCQGTVENNTLSGAVRFSGHTSAVVRHNSMPHSTVSAGCGSTPIVYQNLVGRVRADRWAHPVVMWNTMTRPPGGGLSGIEHMNRAIHM